MTTSENIGSISDGRAEVDWRYACGKSTLAVGCLVFALGRWPHPRVMPVRWFPFGQTPGQLLDDKTLAEETLEEYRRIARLVDEDTRSGIRLTPPPLDEVRNAVADQEGFEAVRPIARWVRQHPPVVLSPAAVQELIASEARGMAAHPPRRDL